MITQKEIVTYLEVLVRTEYTESVKFCPSDGDVFDCHRKSRSIRISWDLVKVGRSRQKEPVDVKGNSSGLRTHLWEYKMLMEIKVRFD